MKIGIHHRTGYYSDRWIRYCVEQGIDYKIVNCYETNIIEQLKDCDALLWHHMHVDYRDTLFAKQLLFSLQQAGKIVFPGKKSNAPSGVVEVPDASVLSNPKASRSFTPL